MTDKPPDRGGAPDPVPASPDPVSSGPASPEPGPARGDPDTAGGPPRTQDTVGVRHGMFGVRGSGDTSGYGGLVSPTVMPGGSPPPDDGADDDDVVRALAAALRERGGPGLREAVEQVGADGGHLTLHVRREHLPVVALALRDAPDLRFEMSLGLSGVHYPDSPGRELHVVYPLQSITHNRRLLLETWAPDADPHIPSLTRVYPTTDWHERETYDFFGVIFDGHPSLTRIEMPDDWQGHPQRKDYPLGGIPVQYKGATVASPDQRRAYS